MRRALQKIALAVLCATLILPVIALGADNGKLAGVKGKAANASDPESYNAILIGIDDYESFPTLSTPVADVEALAAVLEKDYGFTVTLLTDHTKDKPTNRNIQKLIREKAMSLTEKDNLMVYYAGHGSLDELGTGDGYWIPIDGKADDPSSWIPHEQITKLMGNEKGKIKSFILVADSCYSGSMMRSIKIEPPGRADDDTLTKRMLEGAGKRSRIIVSSGGNEPVPDQAFGSKHSLFAHYFLEGLKENKKRYLDVGALFNTKVKPEVEKRIKQKPLISRLTSAVDEDGIFLMTKAGGELPKPKVDLNAVNDKLKQEKAALQAQIRALTASQSGLKDEIESMNKKQLAAKKEYEARLSELESKRSSLSDDRSRLDEADKKNRADELKLQALLREKDALSADKMAEIKKEQGRISALNSQIDSQRTALQGKERSLAEAEANLKKNEAKMNAKIMAEEQKIAELKEKEKAFEAKARQADEARKAADDKIAKANEELKQMEETKKQLADQIKIATSKVAGIYSNSTSGDAKGRFVVLGDVVFDKKTNLMWLKDANYANSGEDFENAEKYVSGLKVAGYGNWQLPSKEEWRSLIPENVKGIDNSLPDNPFRNIVVSGQYWVSSLMGSQGINLGHGGMSRLNKKNPAYIWPVRYATPDEITKFKSQ
jgi:predicted  nucleic acid-binding Zn-ribbon protein